MKPPPSSSRKLPLAIAMAASVVIHIFLLMPGLMAAMAPGSRTQIASLLETSPPENEDSLIGLEESEASTLDWIGYKEYQEHLAEHSDTNQAAFTLAPSTPALPSELPQSEPAEMTEANAAAEVEPEAVEVVEPIEEEVADPGPITEPAEIAQSPIDFAVLVESARLWAISTFGPRPTASARPPLEEPSPAHEVVEHPATATTPSSPPPASPRSESTGDIAEKESDPSSTIDVSQDQWVLGKPLAAGGLELFPQRPSFTLLTRMTAAVRNPVALLEFDRRGVVTHAELVKSSGHAQVDKNIIDSLYGWRAKGKQLAALASDKSFPVTMQFLLID